MHEYRKHVCTKLVGIQSNVTTKILFKWKLNASKPAHHGSVTPQLWNQIKSTSLERIKINHIFMLVPQKK